MSVLVPRRVMTDADEFGRIPAQSRRVPLLEESAEVEKRQVDRGGYRLTKTVNAHDEVVDIELQADHVTLERKAVGAVLPAGVQPVTRQEGDVTIYPVLKEILVTEKRWLLVEEIHITRSINSYRHPTTVTLLSEDIRVERLEPDNPFESGRN